MPSSPQKPATTAALARHLGLSRWTISRVLNGHPGVLPATVERVHRAMEELGYQPNALARSLRGGKTGTIGVCFQEIESPILVRKTAILQQQLREQGRHTLIELTSGNVGMEEQVIRHFLSMRVDGIVLIGSQLNEEEAVLRNAREQSTPVVWIDPERANSPHCVRSDRAYAMGLTLEHLYGLGHRRFVTLGIDPTDSYGAIKLEGLRRAAKRLKLDYDKVFLHHYEAGVRHHDYALGERLASHCLTMEKPPSAAIVLNDRVAIGLMHSLRKEGWEFPRDLSMVGYDNLEISDYSWPRLSSVDQRPEALMRKAAEMLDTLLAGGKGAQSIKPVTVRPSLIERDSTRRVGK